MSEQRIDFTVEECLLMRTSAKRTVERMDEMIKELEAKEQTAKVSAEIQVMRGSQSMFESIYEKISAVFPERKQGR